MSKPVKVKPGMYALFYERLKLIAKEYGYNLVLHGSMDRDLDLIAIPWVNEPQDELLMIQDFHEHLTGMRGVKKENYHFSVLPGNRHSYVIELNRGDKSGEWNRFFDEEYYLDISVTQI
jgi:hypothetical protein